MSKIHHKEQETLLLGCSVLFTPGLVVSTSSNDQVNTAGNDYVNVKQVLPVIQCI